MAGKKPFEEIPTTRTGNRVLRRRRRHQGKFRTLTQKVSRFFRGMLGKGFGAR